MKNQWVIWAFVLGIVAVVLFAFNYQGRKETVPLSQIFPQESAQTPPAKSEAVNPSPQTGEAAQPAVPAQKMTPPAPMETKTAMRPEAPAPAPAAPKPSATAKRTHGGYTIQVASLHGETGAQAELKKVVAAGFPGRIVKKDLGSKGVWYRIYVGSFVSKAQAEEELAKVRHHYKNSFVRMP